jgi:hypothetical protein
VFLELLPQASAALKLRRRKYGLIDMWMLLTTLALLTRHDKWASRLTPHTFSHHAAMLYIDDKHQTHANLRQQTQVWSVANLTKLGIDLLCNPSFSKTGTKSSVKHSINVLIIHVSLILCDYTSGLPMSIQVIKT